MSIVPDNFTGIVDSSVDKLVDIGYNAIPFARAVPKFRREGDTYNLSDVILDGSRAISLITLGFYHFNPYSDANEVIQRNLCVYLASTAYSYLVHYNIAKVQVLKPIEKFINYLSGIAKNIHKTNSMPLLMAGLVSPNIINHLFQHYINQNYSIGSFGDPNSSLNYTTPIHFYTAIMAAKSLDKSYSAIINRETNMIEKIAILGVCIAGAYQWENREFNVGTQNKEPDTTSDITAGISGFIIGLDFIFGPNLLKLFQRNSIKP
jgi:hypothetical protein